ncbi:ABC transporter [Gymnopus androsaceus JB14]|uniref:ABC transporter n=1 Tax=Gymnopus androsaceus JB14 TaxID=1447944 RepID=A0A6A4HBU5_9AGAR|nr:ABC transporter [Gymnopus androsaceus JB14]
MFPTTRHRSFFFPAIISLLSLTNVRSQTCENFGQINGTSCDCPTGFGGSTCSELACGGNIFQGSQRPLTSESSGFANLTSSGCACQSGWTGTACNVCQSASACQNAANALGISQSSLTGTDDGQNNTLVCNTSPKVSASSQMSCNVNNPTLQALYPLSSTLNIIRTLDPSLSPLPNVTSFGSAGSLEQFYCKADSCVQDTNNWSCQNLQCVCRPNTTFCGAVPATNLTGTINTLSGTLDIDCGDLDNSTQQASCSFKQATIESLFGSSGLVLEGCSFGECLRQSVLDSNGTSTPASSSTRASLSGGVIAGLAVVGGLLLIAALLLLLGWLAQRRARRSGYDRLASGNVTVEWSNVSYIVPASTRGFWKKRNSGEFNDDKVILDSISGRVLPGQMMAILGPSATLVGHVEFPSTSQSNPRIGFVPQQDVLPPTLTVYEALLFAARLRLPETVPDVEKRSRVDALLQKLGIESIRNVRIGDNTNGRARGISGGEMRRVSIGLELIASPDILILDEPTSGLDSVSAARVANVLRSIAHDPSSPTAVIASIHQPSSQLYQSFDTILVLSHGHALYSGPGSFAPVDHLTRTGVAPPYQQGYNVADYLLEVASDPPLALLQSRNTSYPTTSGEQVNPNSSNGLSEKIEDEKSTTDSGLGNGRLGGVVEAGDAHAPYGKRGWGGRKTSKYAATFLTQLQYLSGREWKILRRDKTLFFTHVAVAAVLGVFCGGLYFNISTTIAGFQSRVGCLFFLGALIAFSSLSALYNIVEIRPLFLRERSGFYYSPTAWLLSRFLFDVVPLRLIPTIIVSTITYWMAGLAPDAAHFFKFLLILVLYTLALTLFNFLLGTLFRNGGIAILLSALTALYQMTYAGFFVHLNSIPPVLRWLQWLCPLKYCLEALSVNEVGSGLMIQDTLQGVPVDVSASLIMNLLFGFGENNYYRDVLVLFAFIAGFGLSVIGIVWLKVRERR